MDESVKLIVGLGNPGAKYSATRHNVGFWLVDHLAQRGNAPFSGDKRFNGDVARLALDGRECWLLKPATYMNRSGLAVAALASYYKIPDASILVVHDELDLPPGAVKIKRGGGHGGHNGIRHVMECLSTAQFLRMRIGIGHPGNRDAVTDYVLGPPGREERKVIEAAIDEALAAVPLLMQGSVDRAVQRLHTQK